MNEQSRFPSRRRVVVAGAYASLAFTVGDAWAQPDVAPTPTCHDGDEPTLPETEGPFFKPKSPRRSDLREGGIAGRPVANALVDLWQADDRGEYDNKGFRLRGHVFTDPQGRYAFRTIMPGLYPGRTRHYHVKVQAPNRPVLTTQFYFPDEPQNRADEFFHRELVMRVAAADDALRAQFDVVLAMR
jgi:hypothetical protein